MMSLVVLTISCGTSPTAGEQGPGGWAGSSAVGGSGGSAATAGASTPMEPGGSAPVGTPTPAGSDPGPTPGAASAGRSEGNPAFDTSVADAGGPPAGAGSDAGAITDASNCPGVYDLPACVAEMASAGGGRVILGRQTYLLTQSLILQNEVDIVGQGSGTTIAWDDSVKASIDEPLLFSSTVDDILLESFQLLCSIDQDPASNDLRNDHMGLFLDCGGDPLAGDPAGCNDIVMKALEVAYCSNGMHIKGASRVTATDLDLHHNGNTELDLFHNIYFRRASDLILVQTTPVSGGYHDSPRGHGIRGSHLLNVYLDGLSIYGNADHGVHLDVVEKVRFHNVDVRDNCSNFNGACAPVRCYGAPCELDLAAPREP